MFRYEISGDRVSTVVELQVTTIKGSRIDERKVFMNPVDAQLYVQNHMHQYLVLKLRKYIMHAFNVGSHSQSPNYEQTERVMAMAVCLDFLRWIKHKNLHDIILWVKQNRVSLTRILPVATNTSYNTSKNNLNEILNLANQVKLN